MNDVSHVTSDLGQHFAMHLSAIANDIDRVEVEMLWQAVATRYNEAHRAYHTLHHLKQLFAQFEQVKHNLYEPHIIALALYYHDVIYEPTRADNELKSADYAVEALRKYLSAEQCQHIYALIMMTATHQLDALADDDKCSDAAYLLDMDLSVLGAVWSEYEPYASAVRKEYAHVPATDYRIGRTAVLKGLLAHPRLYLTDYYFERLEEQARDNIKREITSLAA
ncbi:hypothetical protein IOD06_04595 [Psychrobacter sp. N25K4-3-2]|jgi:predicted metal-dependent HD superfamily phosphohydrolase|uniref:HD domain-containing protein n=1 Tax=Psychrobacter sp. N25K4-3-2 TaxID=2785026 RepID=UPI00188D17B1|nr:hypothetical protein [Psychrobacter sp. N25K4-3-2]MBF4489163.1 hypothetical protein [Psychrobacter sp. N25K4-3-2]